MPVRAGSCRLAQEFLDERAEDGDDLLGFVAVQDQGGQQAHDAVGRDTDQEPGVADIRGQGLMIGIELDRPCGDLLGRAAGAGLMISVTAERVIRLLPALILSSDEAAQIVAILVPLIKAHLAESA